MTHTLRGHSRAESEHGHGHPHDHRSWSRRALHRFGEFFGGHSHDSADQVDEALEGEAAGRQALYISLGVLALTASVQAVIVVTSGSVALLGDTVHNFADALTALPLLVAFGLARRAANDRYTYGYGRAEDIAGIFVILMIAFSAAFAAYASVRRLLDPQDIDHLGVVALAALIGFSGNEWVARYRIKVGHQIGSAALVADGLHARTDGFTSLAVLLGVGGAALGWQWADPVVGLLITVAILGVLRSAARQVGARLMDAVEPGLVDLARDAVRSVEGVREVTQMRLRWIGHTLRAEASVEVDSGLSLADAHEVAHHVEAHLVAFVPKLTAATVHVGPQPA
jgi:cation diffusion facilitator family transporter